VKEHLDPSQFCGKCEWRQILHVPNVELRPDFVGHVERRLPETHVHTYNIIVVIIFGSIMICNKLYNLVFDNLLCFFNMVDVKVISDNV